jgi:hypothetical protein
VARDEQYPLQIYYDNTYRNMLDRGFISKRNSENGKKAIRE